MKAILIANGKVGSKLAGTSQHSIEVKHDPGKGFYINTGGLFTKSEVVFRTQVVSWSRVDDQKELASISGAAIGARYGAAGGGPLGTLIGMGLGAVIARKQSSDKKAISMRVSDGGSLYDYVLLAEADVVDRLLRDFPVDKQVPEA